MRRVLLSSLSGAAIVEAHIYGVDHEYTSVDGVQEDVTDVLLNLKGVAIRMLGAPRSYFELKKSGPCVIYASDIELDHDIEIINPEHVIAHLNKQTDLEMDLKVRVGRGYQPANLRLVEEDENTVGSLHLDASFSPITRVAYTVESARVEQRTNLDRLIIELETNGTVDS